MGYERFIFWFWESPTTGWHACKVKNTSFSYNMHLFLPYLLNDSQKVHSTIHFSKPLLCVTLICGDWSDWLISFKAEHSVVYSVTGETAIVNAPKVAPSGNKWAGNMLMFHDDVKMKLLKIRFLKTTPFNDSESTLFFERQYFIHGALSDLKLCRMFSFT